MSLSHLTDDGTVRMVDVTDKDASDRRARAQAVVKFPEGVLDQVLAGESDKGEVFATARVAGIEGAKQTPETIPMAHPIQLTSVQVDLEFDRDRDQVRIVCEARARDATGVEMEALCGANTAALTLYDMCKGLSKGIEIQGVKLLKKTGGKSGDWSVEEESS